MLQFGLDKRDLLSKYAKLKSVTSETVWSSYFKTLPKGMTDSNGDLFKTIDPERSGTTTEEVIFQLREMIHRGELRSGDRLPPERDLAKLLGVSRPTLRDGIRSLAAVGVLQPRRGAGTFVVKAEGSPALDSNPLRLMASLHGFTSAEMFEARRSLEMAIAGLAAERATGEQLASMSEEIAEMFASLDDPEQFLVHDMRFHQTVAAASGNRILTSLMNMVATILFDVRSKTVRRAKDLKESAEMHRTIYRAIRKRNAEAASEAMRDHLMLAQKAQASEETDDAATAGNKRSNNSGTNDGHASWSSANRNEHPAPLPESHDPSN